MRYLPHTPEDIAGMLDTIGVRDIDDLFAGLPEDARLDRDLDLPGPLDEQALNRHMDALSGANNCDSLVSWLGAGCYEHFVPAIVPQLVGRSEFFTAYTPYQPELSQGTLQAVFEYQTLVCRLLGMDVSNASMYDGASAFAEALLMAVRIKKKRSVVLSDAINPLYRRVASTYLGHADIELRTIPSGGDGMTGTDTLEHMDDVAAVAVQSPNFFGLIEDTGTLSDAVHDRDVLLVSVFTEPLAFGLYNNPGRLGADIVCGEGRSFGLGQSFGGPALGVLCARKDFVRAMPGRIVGKTADLDGRPGYVITLSTREQHIRRERATSNICTNQSLCALTAAIYLSALGKNGLRSLARLNYDTSEYLKASLADAGFRPRFDGQTFNEFVVETPEGFDAVESSLKKHGHIFGIPLGTYYPALEGCRLVCATETKRREDIDALIREVRI